MTLAIALSLALAQAPATADAPVAAPVADAPATPAPAPRPSAWYDKVSINGYARVGLFYTFPLRDQQLVGSNGGFRVADFRLGAEFRPVDKLTIASSVELAAPLIDPNDPLAGRRIVELRDAYVQYDLCRYAQVRAGQYRPPYYAEMLIADASIPFTSRSVIANGFNPPEAYGPRTPLAPDRQIGLQVGSERLGSETVGFRYTLGVFNGNLPNTLFNDNNGVMPVGRVEVDWSQKVTLGVNASYNVVAQGVRPAQLYANQLSYGADVALRLWRLEVLAAFLGRSTSFNFVGLNPESAMGVLGQVRYSERKYGLEAAVRVAYYEPSSAQADDQVIEAAAMIGWRPFELPFRVLLQFTHRDEEARVAYPNDSVDVMLHATW